MHDNTLKLLQEQEERMKRELEELTMLPELERKPISSDVQEVLKEMEELRIQFNEAKIQHEKALEDLTAQRVQEVKELKESHEMLLQAMMQERDAVQESLKALQESGEMTERERVGKIKELEDQLEESLKNHADAVAKHAEALDALRSEMDATWTAQHDSEIQELTKTHAGQLQSLQEQALATATSKDAEIQDLKDSFAKQIKDLEDGQESRVLELVSKHDAEIQEWKDKWSNEKEEHEELMNKLKQEHADAVDQLNTELRQTKEAKEEVEMELAKVNVQTKEELEQVRAEMEEIRKLLAVKDAETEELKKRVEELTEDLENASMSAMLKNTKKYKVKPVQIYGSSVSGNLKTKRAQQSISDTLEQLDIEYEFVDCSVDEEAKRHMRRKNRGEKELPQIFSGGEYRGIFDDFEYAIETHQLAQFLGFDRVKGFVPRHKVEFNHGDASLAQDGEDAEQGAGFPSLVVNGMGNRSSMPLGLSAGGSKNGVVTGNNNKDIGTSMYLLSPASNRFQSNSSLASNSSTRSNGSHSSLKPGFVQTASQVWNGALKEDITHAKHDLGFLGAHSVIPDDDELEELFEQGAVTEAELAAMLETV
ncbi:hypothetical protein EDD11_002271 [Mortierella claussenii]|nr:hypothetical protein EDD11_002271 [Mortierella claussenii]